LASQDTACDFKLTCSYGSIPSEPIKPHVKVATSAEEACKDAEAIVICTEWDEFKNLDWQKSESSARSNLN